MNNLFIIGIAQALFFSLFLFTKKENQMANHLLAVLLVLISFSLFLNYAYSTNLILKIPFLIGTDTVFPFIYGPILYLYTRILVSKKHRLNYKDTVHLIPFAVYFIYVFLNFYVKSSSYKLEYLYSLRNLKVPTDLIIANYLKILQAVIYLIFTLKIVGKHQVSIKSEFSYTEKINLNWLKILAYSLISIYGIKFFGIVLSTLVKTVSTGEIEMLTDLSIILFIYIIAFWGIKQPEIFKKWHQVQNRNSENRNIGTLEKNQSVNEIPKYSGSSLSAEESRKLLVKLENLMEETKVFLQSELTIKEIADKLDINTKYLSQVINEQLGKNFFNFINTYRVEEVKKRLADKKYKHLSILGIALDCGFNSKSSFNSIFKQATGLTPSSYISTNS